MGIRVSINDVGDRAARVAVRLEQVGVSKLRDQLQGAIERGCEGLEGELRMSALEKLPKRGGLGPAMARSRISRGRTPGLSAGLVFKVKSPYDAEGLDQGVNIHPLFGNKRHWYLQHVPNHWITGPLRDRGPLLDFEVRKAMEEVARGVQ